MRLHAYFDYGSPYAYLAWQRIRAHPDRYANCEVLWKPISAGHIFKQDGSQPNVTLPNQAKYLHADIRRWAAAYGVPFAPPADGTPGAMPINTIKAGRLHLAADHQDPETEAKWMQAVFLAYFEQSRDISDDAVLDDLCAQVGLKGGSMLCMGEGLKRLLVANTQEAYAAGAPGVPYFILEDDAGRREPFWGNDRLPWIEAMLTGKAATL